MTAELTGLQANTRTSLFHDAHILSLYFDNNKKNCDHPEYVFRLAKDLETTVIACQKRLSRFDRSESDARRALMNDISDLRTSVDAELATMQRNSTLGDILTYWWYCFSSDMFQNSGLGMFMEVSHPRNNDIIKNLRWVETT